MGLIAECRHGIENALAGRGAHPAAAVEDVRDGLPADAFLVISVVMVILLSLVNWNLLTPLKFVGPIWLGTESMNDAPEKAQTDADYVLRTS